MSTSVPATPDPLPESARAVLEFWFGPGPTTPSVRARPEWFRKDPAFDARIRDRFGALVDEALNGVLTGWPSPWGGLARILLLDQFTRNAYRDTPRAFAGDPLALAGARRLVAAGADLAVPPVQRSFAYLPFEHAEDLAMQDEAVRLFRRLESVHPESANNRNYAERHRAVIAKFGRFPHRNAILGRTSTPDEIAFLATPGSSF